MPVVLPSGRANEFTKSRAEHIVGHRKDRNRLRRLLCRANCDIASNYDDINPALTQLDRIFRKQIDVWPICEIIDGEVLAVNEAPTSQFVEKRIITGAIARNPSQQPIAIGSPRLAAPAQRPAM